ncbi:hypothetical protein PHYPSEUDO_001924 [Phytophthora pseudosyringae]|uniref:Uncharacterized protein n=1 Tax=Phytophthora pseudosyringae TaxID=221518 RepID=A0A8T1VUE5_9STRA|nr:hypothetical protein PHYPSEUDO_001924 [Phytophthora pseudosyringae]
MRPDPYTPQTNVPRLASADREADPGAKRDTDLDANPECDLVGSGLQQMASGGVPATAASCRRRCPESGWAAGAPGLPATGQVRAAGPSLGPTDMIPLSNGMASLSM